MSGSSGPVADGSGEVNHHCCVVEAMGIGVLIEGSSGSGKTSVCMGLLEAMARDQMDHAFVCDDQALLDVVDCSLVAHAPRAIAGMAELRGYGIVELPHKEQTMIGLVARIVDDDAIRRMPDRKTVSRVGGLSIPVAIPLIELPERHEAQAVRILCAKLREVASAPRIAAVHAR